MNCTVLLRRLVSAVLITGLLLSCSTAAAASTEETVSPEQTTEATVFFEPTEPDALETTEAAEPGTEPAEIFPQETTVPTEETEILEETAAATVPVLLSETPCSVAYVKKMPSPGSDLVLRGTIVVARNGNYVLQDGSGGISLVFSQEPELSLKDKVEVTGDFDQVFTVNHVTPLGTADLPKAKETSLGDAPDALRVVIRQAELEDGRLVQEGFDVELRADLPASAEGLADVYGVLLNGVFYADTVVPLETDQEEATAGEWNFYFGLLHAHTDISDGLGTVEEAFQHAYGVEDLDFFAVTDHSESLDNASGGRIGTDGRTVSEAWAAGKKAAEAVTDETFVGIFGYEMSWPDDLSLGHISTFHTPGWESWDAGTPENRNDDYFVTLPRYYDALTTVPGSISQFNHPYHTYGNFRNFRDYSPAYDQVIHLIEVGSGDETCDEAAYHKALDAGWHLAPTINQNNKKGAWGDASSVRTVVLAKELTENALYEAMREHRVYATEDQDLQILYRINGAIMGSILGPQEALTASILTEDPTDGAGCQVEVITDGGKVADAVWVDAPEEIFLDLPLGHSYYYLRITQADGDVAVTAPVWVDSYEDVGIRSFQSSQDLPLEGEAVTLTLEVYNNESEDFIPEKFTIYQKNEVLKEETQLDILGSMDTMTYTLPFCKDTAGTVELTAVLTGTIGGDWRRFEKTLTFFYQARPESIESCRIGDLRSLDNLGLSFCVRGYVTAGNENPNTTFPDAIYIQDDTGGIMVTGVETQNIEIGQPMEVIGVLRSIDGNLQLEQTDHTLLEETFYRYVPRITANKEAMNLSVHGGELLQVQGTVMSVTTEGKAVSRFTLKDIRGDVADVVIEDAITSGATGRNELASQVKKGRTVRAIGLLHVDENGEHVLRVRNCDEVVYVIPAVDSSNPPTGDWFWLLQ